MPDTYQKISKAIKFFVDHQSDQPGLIDVANHVGLSEFHLQRVFSEWVGLSPKQFLQFLTKENAKSHLRSMTVNEASFEAGLSGSSRLHDLMVQCEGVTPGEFKKQGVGLQIRYGCGASPFGWCFLAITERGICKLVFFDTLGQFQQCVRELESEWPKAELLKGQEDIEMMLSAIFSRGKGLNQERKVPLKVLLKGTPFQIKVWQALLEVRTGQLCSYQSVANQIGSPSSVRAVASAIAKNNIAYLIPCHRVIRSTGAFNQYRWGVERKIAMIGWEQALNEGAKL